MNSSLYRHLTWLPVPPVDFNDRCRNLATLDGPIGKSLRALSSHALNENQLARLARAIVSQLSEGRSLAPLTPVRIGLLGNGTTDFIAPALVATAPRFGLQLDCVSGGYDQFVQEAIKPDSKINQARLDVVLLALDHRAYSLQGALGNPDAAIHVVDAAMQMLNGLRSAIRRHSGAICIVQTIAQVPESLFGSFDRALAGSHRNVVEEMNQRIVASVAGTEDVLLDIEALAETVGSAEWHSPALWNLAKLPFADVFVPLYADHVMRIIGAMRGKSRRCLVLDLDNTVWGGVIGDDGVEGIKTSQGDATGEAHLTVQQMAVELRKRGVVLAVNSKNTDSVARRPFSDHPDMLLRQEHIAIFQANWNDKATNLRAIAEALSLGLESLVFLDDNPVERDLVRRELPEVAVPELDDDPASFARTLMAGGYFEAIRFLDEDRGRAEMYEGNARRLDAFKQIGDMDSYLRSLNMRMFVGPFDRATQSRVTQLVNKSNQFNLTTRRYSESEVVDMQTAPDVETMQIRLTDRFGDNGIICVVICRKTAASEWTIDNWLMSCRVLGRKVEHATLAEILLRCRQQEINTLVGVYRPTERNGLVRHHYANLGFRQTKEEPDGTTWWTLSCDKIVQDVPIVVERTALVGAPAEPSQTRSWQA
jgi:FkbH-like protein